MVYVTTKWENSYNKRIIYQAVDIDGLAKIKLRN